MIDLHSHILPSIDDGAKNWEESIRMAKEAVKDGIHTIVATPHHQNIYINPKENVLELVEEMNYRLQAEEIPLTILPGHETRIFGDFLTDLKQDKILTINSNNKYVFLELPSIKVPPFIEQLVFDIQLAGFIPIIPHPERNEDISENPIKIYQLVKRGVLTQITAGSLLGDFGKKVQKFTLELVDANLVHFLATDTHGVKGRRSVKLKEAYQLLEKNSGRMLVDQFKTNAEKVIQGKDLYVEIPNRIVRKKKMFRLF